MTGSKDKVEEVIKEYIKENLKLDIKYFKKENGGLSDARNYGVKKAKGKYLSFLDSDDYIEENLYKDLEKYIDEEIDLIKFKMKKVDTEGKIIENIDGPNFKKCTGEEAFEKLCTTDKYLEVACIYLYKREFFIKNKFEYLKGAYHEDFGLTPLIMLKAKSVVSLPIYGYCYLQTQNSITRNEDYQKNIKKAEDMLKHYENANKKIQDYNIKNKSKELLRRYYTNTLILKTEELKGKEQKEYIKNLRKRKLYKNIKPYNLKQLVKRIILMISIKLYLKMR